MSLPSTLQKLRMYREWIQYSRDQEYEDYDDRWQEFLEDWRYEKSIGMLAESFGAESFSADKKYGEKGMKDGDDWYSIYSFFSDAKGSSHFHPTDAYGIEHNLLGGTHGARTEREAIEICKTISKEEPGAIFIVVPTKWGEGFYDDADFSNPTAMIYDGKAFHYTVRWGAESFSSEDDFDEASWGEGFVEQVYSGDADEMMYLELYANWLNQRNTDYIMRTVDDPDRSPALWNNVYGWWNSLTTQRKEELIDEDIFVKYYNDALESYGDYEPFTEGEAEDFMAEESWWMSMRNSCGNNDCNDGHCPNCGCCKNWALDEDEDERRTGMMYCGSCSHRFNAESFSDWADDELRTHGKDVSFDKWVQEEYEDEPSHRHPNGQLSFIQWSNDEMREKHHAEYISDGTPFWSVIKIQDDGGMDSDWGVEDHDTLEDAKESYDYNIENEEGQFAIMQNDNLGEGNWTPVEWECSKCGNWTPLDSKKDGETFMAPLTDEEFGERYGTSREAVRRHQETVRLLPSDSASGFVEVWDRYGDGILRDRDGREYGRAVYRNQAETFSAETANGNQVFNSCWKCGSGQHLYQISRYPASPEEIAGIGMDPDQALEDWEGRRTPRT